MSFGPNVCETGILLAARWQILFLCFYLLDATFLFSAPGLQTPILQEMAIDTMLIFQINHLHLWSNYENVFLSYIHTDGWSCIENQAPDMSEPLSSHPE